MELDEIFAKAQKKRAVTGRQPAKKRVSALVSSGPTDFARLNARLPPEHPEGIKKVNVALSTDNLREDWWNAHQSLVSGIDEVMNMARPWRWSDKLAFVYAERFVERLPIEEAARFFACAGCALAPGGRLRLATPSLEWVIETHFSFSPSDLSARLLDTFNTNRAFYGWGHRFLYSKEMLKQLLSNIGFEGIIFCKPGQSDVIELRGLETYASAPVAGEYDDVWIVEGIRAEKQPAVSVWLDSWLRTTYMQYLSDSDHSEFRLD
jgi:predicted SAM-dependent methyltransferase